MGRYFPCSNLNGYKIANPTILAPHFARRIGPASCADTDGRRTTSWAHETRNHASSHGGKRLDAVVEDIRRIQTEARERGDTERPRWPMIVFGFAEGLDRPQDDRRRAERGKRFVRIRCRFRIRRRTLSNLAQLEAWLRSYRPEELFDSQGRLIAYAGCARAPRAIVAWARIRTRMGGKTAAGTFGCRISPNTPRRRPAVPGTRGGRRHPGPSDRFFSFCAMWPS